MAQTTMDNPFFCLDSELSTMRSSSFINIHWSLIAVICHVKEFRSERIAYFVLTTHQPSPFCTRRHIGQGLVLFTLLSFFAFSYRFLHVVLVSFPLFLLHSAVHPRATLFISQRLFGFLSIHQYFLYAISACHQYFINTVHILSCKFLLIFAGKNTFKIFLLLKFPSQSPSKRYK